MTDTQASRTDRYSRILDRVTYHAVYDDSILAALRFALDHGFAGVQVAAELPHLDPTELTDPRPR